MSTEHSLRRATGRLARVWSWRAAAAAAVLAVPVLYMMRPLLFSARGDIPGIDASNLYWWEYFTRSNLHAGRLPHWNPFHFAGTPHFADPQTMVLYPMALALRWLPIPAFLSWMMALHFWIGGLGALCLGRVLGLGWLIATAAAVAVMTGGSAGGWLNNGHLLLIDSAAWFPWALALAIVSVRRGGSLPHPALPVVLVLQFLAGYLQGALYTAAVIGGYFAWSAIWPEQAGARRRDACAQLVVLTLLSLGLAAFQLAPLIRLIGEASRANSLPYDDAIEGSWRIADLVRFFRPFHGLASEPPYRALADNSVYVGWLLAALAPVALFDRVRRSVCLFLVIVAVVAVGLALATSLPLYRLHYWLFPGLRVPGRALFIAASCVAMLGAIGFARVVALFGGTRASHLVYAAGAIAVLADAPAVSARAARPVAVPAPGALVQFMGLPNRGRALSLCEHRVDAGELLGNGQSALDGMAGIELADFAAFANLARSGDTPPDDGVFRRIGSKGSVPARPDLLDMANTTTLVTCAPLSSPSLARIAEHDGLFVYNRLSAWPRAIWTCGAAEMTRSEMLRVVREQWFDSDGRLRPRVAVNVRWVPGTSAAARRAAERRYHLSEGVAREHETWRYVLDDASPENAQAMMRDAHIADTAGLDRHSGAPIPGPPPAPGGKSMYVLTGITPCATAGAQVMPLTVDDPRRSTFAVSAPRDGLLVVSEAFYPERRAFVDGREVEARRANVAFTAIPIPAGIHRVELRYVPRAFQIGAAISALTALLWGWTARRWQPRLMTTPIPECI